MIILWFGLHEGVLDGNVLMQVQKTHMAGKQTKVSLVQTKVFFIFCFVSLLVFVSLHHCEAPWDY